MKRAAYAGNHSPRGNSMKAFLSVKIALLPFAAFWTLSGMGWPHAGALLGVVLATSALAYRIRTGGAMLLETTALVFLSLLVLLGLSPLAGYAMHAVAASFLALGAACAISVSIG